MKTKGNSLSEKKCVACDGGMAALSTDEIQHLLRQLKQEWKINKEGHLWRNFEFKDFALAMKFANHVAEIAEAEGHHPDLHISWGRCGVEIWTHKINGLTESDFILAAKIDKIK